MANQAPFVAHFRVVPFRGKRFETIRSLQRVAKLIYDGFAIHSNINVAIPGGGQFSNLDDFSGYAPGCAVKPQFGETPAQLMIAGFYSGSTKLPHQDKTVISGGEWYIGYGGSQLERYDPTSTTLSEAKALKAILDAIIAAQAPGESVSVWRLDYKNIIFGDAGISFPQ